MGVRRALILSAGAKYSALVIQLASTMILARLLSPAEIGVYSVCAAFVGIAHSMRDFGVSAYLIHEKELTKDKISTALGITMGISWFLALCVACLAYPLAVFYEEQGIQSILFVLATNFIFIPFGSVYLALFRRNLQFGTLWSISFTSVVVHAATSVCLAALGLSFMSLAWASIAGTLATVIGVTISRRGHGVIIPSLRERVRVFGFGSRVGVSSIAGEIGNGAPDMVIGRLIGIEAVGLYSRAMGFVSLFEKSVLEIIGSVALPHFSALNREGVNANEQYVRILEFVVAIAWPVLLFMGLMASPLIEILYGTQWAASVPLAQILVLAIGLRCMKPMMSAIIVAQGEAALIMRTQFAYQAARIAFVIVGAMHNLELAAFGLVLGELVGVLLFSRAVSGCGIGMIADYIKAAARCSGIALFTVLPVLLPEIMGMYQSMSEIGVFFYSIPLVMVSWVAALWLFHSPLRVEVLKIIKIVMRAMQSIKNAT